MERKLRFRGRRSDNGEWVCGDVLHVAGGCLIYFGSEEAEHDIGNCSPIAVEFFKDEIAVVDRETVGQFTGLCDKNGKEIYEGDILRLGKSDCGVCEVKWNDWASAFCIRFCFESELGQKPLGIWRECERYIEVLGNMYDNSELMKRDK